MSSVNKAIVMGNLGSEPTLRYTDSGTAVANARVATTNKWTDNDGNLQEQTEWHRVVVFGGRAKNMAKHLVKGQKIYVEGRLQTRKWQGDDGSDRYTTEIVADNVRFLGKPKGARNKQQNNQQNNPQNNQGPKGVF